MPGIEALEDDVPVAPADVEGFLEFQLVALVSDCDGSAASYIDHSDLTALGENSERRMSGEVRVSFSATGMAPPTMMRSNIE